MKGKKKKDVRRFKMGDRVLLGADEFVIVDYTADGYNLLSSDGRDYVCNAPEEDIAPFEVGREFSEFWDHCWDRIDAMNREMNGDITLQHQITAIAYEAVMLLLKKGVRYESK